MAAIVSIPELGNNVTLALNSVPKIQLNLELTVHFLLQHSGVQLLIHPSSSSIADGSILGSGIWSGGALVLRPVSYFDILAVVMTMLIAPPIADLAICVFGNLRRSSIQRKKTAQDVRLAVIVPAHDQEPAIAKILQSFETAGCSLYVSHSNSTSTSTAWAVQVFVVAHNCKDGTAAVAAGCGARVVALDEETDHSKSAALRRGIEEAQLTGANAFLLIDADASVGPNLIAATRAALIEGAMATQCRVELETPPSDPVSFKARLRATAFRAKNVLQKRGRSGLEFSAGVIGNGFAVTADALNRVPLAIDGIYGGLEYHAHLVSEGIRVRWVDHTFVYAEPASVRAAGATRKARLLGRLQVARRVTGRLFMALLRGRWRAAAELAEIWSLPLSAVLVALLVIAFLPFRGAHIFVIAIAAMVFLYWIEAVFLGPEPWRALASPFVASFQFLRKRPVRVTAQHQSRKEA
jgi:uncharacterized protein YbjQ (UPF0145 family)